MFDRFVQFAVVILALVIGTQAHAAPLRYGTYYDETIGGGCSSPAVSCAAWFSGLPSDKLVMVQRIQCNFVGNLPLVKARFGVSATSGGVNLAREIALPLSIANTTANSNSYFAATDTQTGWLMGQGRFPFVEVFTNQPNGLANFSCTLIGTLVDPIQ